MDKLSENEVKDYAIDAYIDYTSTKDVNSMATELLELRERTNGVCKWKMDYEGNYETDCGHSFFFDAGTATENEVKFCGYCGRPLVDVPYVEPEDE